MVEGLEHAPDALNLLFTGGNTGKVIVKVAGVGPLEAPGTLTVCR